MKRRNKYILFFISAAILLAAAALAAYPLISQKTAAVDNQVLLSNPGEVQVEPSSLAAALELQGSIETTADIDDALRANKLSYFLVRNAQRAAEKKRFEGKTLLKNDKGIPVLMYHCIDRGYYANGSLDELKVPTEVFREQMKYLKENDFTTLTMTELYNLIANNEGVPEKSVVLTFDDGYLDNYTNALPILKEYGLNATCFVISSMVDKVTHLYANSEQLKEMELEGFEIQGHTVSHPRLDTLSYDQQLKELRESKDFLEKLLDRKVDYLAYPYGKYNENTIKAAKEVGYTMAFTTAAGLSDKGDGMLTLNRLYISSHYSMEVFKAQVNRR